MKRLSRHILTLDPSIVILLASLILIGILTQYSASDGMSYHWMHSHCIGIITLIPAFIALSFVNYSTIIRYSPALYCITTMLLIIVLVSGKTTMGATRWIAIGTMAFQPSEFAKLSMILMIASCIHRLNISFNAQGSFFIIPVLVTVVPAMLTFVQPNLGTGIIIVATGCSMLLIAGLPRYMLVIAVVLALSLLPLAWVALLEDYQKTRILTFMHPHSDPTGTGYNILQSKIAIGSGGMMGQGFMRGSQTHLRFLPEKHTDFAFTIVAEEAGFLGSMTLLLIYALLVLRIICIAAKSPSISQKSVCFGVSSIITLHVVINIGMGTGLVPVVGLPLPFISYGRSFLATCFASLGVVQSIYRENVTVQRQNSVSLTSI